MHRATVVAHLRRLQEARGRLDVLRIQRAVTEATRQEAVAADDWQAITQDWQRTIRTVGTLCAVSAMHWSDALGAVRHRWQQTAAVTREASSALTQQQAVLAVQQQRAQNAQTQLLHLQRRYQHQQTDRHLHRIEDHFTAREHTPCD